MKMTPAERVAQLTWDTLGRARQLRTRFGEETLTDLLVLAMLPHRRAKGFWLNTTTKQAEASSGADLLVAVRHPTGRWSRLALQAKKLYWDDKYRALNSVQKSVRQLKKLERFAQQFHALPLYLLYNHSNTAQHSEHWHCGASFAVGQLGCTLVPSWHIRQMIDRRPPRNFNLAHTVSQSKPWRCAFDCPYAEEPLSQMAFRTLHRDPDTRLDDRQREYDWPFEPVEDAWPERLLHTSKTELTKEDVDRARSEEFNPAVSEGQLGDDLISDEKSLYPSRLLIVEIDRSNRQCDLVSLSR